MQTSARRARRNAHSTRARRSIGAHLAAVVLLAGAALARADTLEPAAEPAPRWLAGDHHIHSHFSVGWDGKTDPPTPVLAGDANYSTPLNARMARRYGLSWMVTTDHGGPNHSKFNLERAYPELLQSREEVPEVIQFYGMEFDTPGADHSSLIIPHTHDEAERLYELESHFAKLEPWPEDPSWDREPRMLEALRAMRALPARPVVIANHPSRSAKGLGKYGLDTPAELRNWNDAAPEVAVGMEGAPGHQAMTLRGDGTIDRKERRGYYHNYPTHGGFDQMTARLGGFWDSMLGEGRRWWITANSDSHVHWREDGGDFWPGEYSKTYVWSTPDHDSILQGIREGRVFVTTGDLISELDLTLKADGREVRHAETLSVAPGTSVEIAIRFLDPETKNHHGDNPSVRRVDLIVGNITGPVSDRSADTNPTTRVLARFSPEDWKRDGAYCVINTRIENVTADTYLRVRGTNGDEMEPEPDPRGEDPWTDLWFYSNPSFISVR
ncbi:MAG: phosphoesterase [Deltaproteobacteria bacterium]|nr:phosphoesterase [Deltaproteobacteria bacterium]